MAVMLAEKTGSLLREVGTLGTECTVPNQTTESLYQRTLPPPRPPFSRSITPPPDGRRIEGTESECAEWGLLLHRCLTLGNERGGQGLGWGNLTDRQYAVGMAVLYLVLQQRVPNPSHLMVAEVARHHCSGCSVSTVWRALVRLREMGLLDWDATYLPGLRRDENNVRLPQNRRTTNHYRLYLPNRPRPAPPPRWQAMARRLHSVDRPLPTPQNPPAYTWENRGNTSKSTLGQRERVTPTGRDFSLCLPPSVDRAARQRQIAQEWGDGKRARQAAIVAAYRRQLE